MIIIIKQNKNIMSFANRRGLAARLLAKDAGFESNVVYARSRGSIIVSRLT